MKHWLAFRVLSLSCFGFSFVFYFSLGCSTRIWTRLVRVDRYGAVFKTAVDHLISLDKYNYFCGVGFRSEALL